MRPKSLILLVLALGCGLIAAVGINQILARPTTEVQTVGIVVAKREIRKGDMIKPDDIRLQEWHVDSMPEGAIQKIEDLAERRVKTNIVPGEAILASKLVGKGINDSVENIPSGMKGVAVKVDKVSSGGGLILPGDNVDVLLHVEANPSKGIPSTATKVPPSSSATGSPVAGSMSPTTIVAPSACIRRAAASPIPLAAPVITATLPANR